jgi:hypothetical protein
VSMSIEHKMLALKYTSLLNAAVRANGSVH